MQGATDLKTFYLNVLQELVSQPTASFHEERVAAKIIHFLRQWGIPFDIDSFGNIIAHYEYGNKSRPLALMAHMDHPAFTITATGGLANAHFTARLEGGVNAKCFEQEVAVKLYPQSRNANEQGLAAKIVGFKQGEKPRDVELYIKLDNPAEATSVQLDDFGIWDLLDFELSEDLIHARVMDDLVGCAATLLTLWKLAQAQIPTNVYGVFTRAEEVGLVGAAACLKSGVLPQDSYIVSLEASKTLPGALQGEGPVVRVGDRIYTFCDEAEEVLRLAVQNLQQNATPGQFPLFKAQRQLMSGGGCEAGAALNAGYLATGLAFPLGNYHNVTEDFRLEPENIHQNDYINGILLLQEAARLMPLLPQIRALRQLDADSKDALSERLRSSVARIKTSSEI